MLAPVLIFTYKRFDTLKNTIEALKLNSLASTSELFVFSDGAKNEKDIESVNYVRTYLKTISGFSRVTIYESSYNKGLANSIIEGVSLVLKEYTSVIVLEDDLLTTPNFLSYMNQSLQRYSSEKKVFSISGYSFNLKKHDNKEDSYFLNRGWSWGWATWRDRWELVDWMVSDYHSFLNDRKARNKFSKGGSDLNSMLKKQMNGKLDSWAIRWFYHQLKISGLTLYPVYSKVFNNGFDENATHTTGASRRYIPQIDLLSSEKFNFPDSIVCSKYYQKQFLRKMGIFSRIFSKIESIIINIRKCYTF